MGNTLINFQGEYFEYGGSLNTEQRGLAIGGFESTWRLDVVIEFLMENMKILFGETSFTGFYRDDGLVIFDGVKSAERLQ